MCFDRLSRTRRAASCAPCAFWVSRSRIPTGVALHTRAQGGWWYRWGECPRLHGILTEWEAPTRQAAAASASCRRCTRWRMHSVQLTQPGTATLFTLSVEAFLHLVFICKRSMVRLWRIRTTLAYQKCCVVAIANRFLCGVWQFPVAGWYIKIHLENVFLVPALG